MDKCTNEKKLSSGISQTRPDLHCLRTNVARFPHKHSLYTHISLLAAYLALLLVNEKYGPRVSNACKCYVLFGSCIIFCQIIKFFNTVYTGKNFQNSTKIQAVMIDMSYSSCVMV